LGKPNDHDHSRELKQMTFLSIILLLTKENDGWIDRYFDNWFKNKFVPEVQSFLKEKKNAIKSSVPVRQCLFPSH
jgi:hypothetical protein